MSYLELNTELVRCRRTRRHAKSPHAPLTPATVTPSRAAWRRARSFNALSYRVPGIVEPVRQPSSMVCWATVTTMMVCWKRSQSMSIETALSTIGQEWVDKYNGNQGLLSEDKARFLAAAGLQGEPPMNYTIEGWHRLLQSYGPLWVTTDEQPGQGFAIHARILVGIAGDGTHDGTQLQLVDPATGTEYSESFARFLAKYEEEARDRPGNFPLRIQVVHWSANAQSAAQSFSRATRRRARAFDAVDYRVPGIVPPIQQPSSMVCWATVTTMLYCWRENASRPIRDVIAQIGSPYIEYFDQNRTLPGSENTTYFTHAGMQLEPPSSFSVQGWENLLRNYGPLILWIHPAGNPANLMHLVVLAGIHGDGTPEGTRFDVVDPARGKEVSVDLGTLTRQYQEVLGPFPPGAELIWQVIHWPSGASVTQSMPRWTRNRGTHGSRWRPSRALDTLLAWGAKVPQEFRNRVREICSDLQCEPNHLMACMAFETGETFSASVKNASSGATGLIQFMPSTATHLGTTTAALSAMSAVEQLAYVKKYFEPYRGKLGTVEDVYMAILWPRAVGQPNSHVLFATPTKAYELNRGLDRDHDGSVTKTEASAFVQRALERGLQSSNAA